jgi:hypothetical protein
MWRHRFFFTALLCGTGLTLSPNLSSQTVTQHTLGVPTLSVMADICPVGLQAQRNGMPVIIATKGQPQEPAQQLRLSWLNRRQTEIVAAAIVVHGFDAAPHVIPADGGSPSELSKVYAIKVDISGGGNAMSELTLRHFAAISAIDLRSIEYANGSRWSAPAGTSCRIAPSPLLLINAIGQ